MPQVAPVDKKIFLKAERPRLVITMVWIVLVSRHNSDIWAMTNPVGLNGGDPTWANWNMGGSVVCEPYLGALSFNGDKSFLEEYYPVLKGAADFCLGWLVGKDGYLVTSPATSPENQYVTPDGYVGATLYGGAADLAMVRQCLADARDAATELGVDSVFLQRG